MTRSFKGFVPAPTTRPVTITSIHKGGFELCSLAIMRKRKTFKAADAQHANPVASPNVAIDVRSLALLTAFFAAPSALAFASAAASAMPGALALASEAASVACRK